MLTGKGKQQGHCFKGSDPHMCIQSLSQNYNLIWLQNIQHVNYKPWNSWLVVQGVSRYHLYNENRETTGWKMFEVATDSTSSTSYAFCLWLFSQATNSWTRSTSPYHTIHRESCFLLSERFYTDVIEIMWLNNAGSSYYYTFVGVVWLHWCTELPSGPHCPWRGILQCSLASSSGYPASPCPPVITGCTNVCRSQI